MLCARQKRGRPSVPPDRNGIEMRVLTWRGIDSEAREARERTSESQIKQSKSMPASTCTCTPATFVLRILQVLPALNVRSPSPYTTQLVPTSLVPMLVHYGPPLRMSSSSQCGGERPGPSKLLLYSTCVQILAQWLSSVLAPWR